MDPYQILGVSSSATDDEVKKAYRAQCKKYHPDLNPDDPTAEEKFKQVQSAYDQVMKMRQGGGSYAQQSNPYSQHQQQSGYADPFGFGGSGGFRFYGPFGFGFDFGGADNGYGYNTGYRQGGSDEPIEMQAVRNYINARRYREALNVLESISNRTAQWYYYHALANLGIGNTINALDDARKAVSMEPNNPTYQQLLNRLQNQGQQYHAQSSNYSVPSFNMGKMCLTFWLCSLCCGGRPFLPFCFCC